MEPSWHTSEWILQHLAYAWVSLPPFAHYFEHVRSSCEIMSILFFQLTSIPWFRCTIRRWIRSMLLVLKRILVSLLFHYEDSFHIVLAFLLRNSFLSLILSSSTWIINLYMYMSSINIATLPFLLYRQDNAETNKLIILGISTTIFGA